MHEHIKSDAASYNPEMHVIYELQEKLPIFLPAERGRDITCPGVYLCVLRLALVCYCSDFCRIRRRILTCVRDVGESASPPRLWLQPMTDKLITEILWEVIGKAVRCAAVGKKEGVMRVWSCCDTTVSCRCFWLSCRPPGCWWRNYTREKVVNMNQSEPWHVSKYAQVQLRFTASESATFWLNKAVCFEI